MNNKSIKLGLVMTGMLLLTACTTYTNQDSEVPTLPAESETTSNSQETTTMPSDAQTLGESTTSKINKYSAPPAASSQEELAGKTATISTDLGDIKIRFFEKEAPQTVTNFIFLAGEKFYDGLSFHRRVEGFVLQGGDPAGNGQGGPGYQVPQEINEHKHVRGAIATARLGDAGNPEKASSGSQFYIVLDDASFLDGEYTVFGEVVEGMEIVDKLQVDSIMNTVTIQ